SSELHCRRRPSGCQATLLDRNLPMGESKAHSLEVQLNRRMSNGLSGFLSFNLHSVRYHRTVEEVDRRPTLGPGAPSSERPFGKGKPFLSDGGVAAALAGGWQVSGTWEFQPGALLDWST